MAGVDDYELGSAIVHVGTRIGGLPDEQARWTVGERPDLAEAIGEMMRPIWTDLAALLVKAIGSYTEHVDLGEGEADG